MASAKANIIIEQGADFSATLTVTNDIGDVVYLGDFVANSAMKKWYTSSNTTVVFNTYISANTGEVTIYLPANQTSMIAPGRYVYDIKLTNLTTNVASRFIEGIATCTPQVSM
jgi:hypothetical protein